MTEVMKTRTPNCTLTDVSVWQDTIEVTTMYPPIEPDPDWLFVDSNGHRHRWSPTGKLATLNRHVETYIDYDGDEGEDITYTCRRCGEEVKPGYRVKPGWYHGKREFIHGMMHIDVKGVADKGVATSPTSLIADVPGVGLCSIHVHTWTMGGINNLLTFEGEAQPL